MLTTFWGGCGSSNVDHVIVFSVCVLGWVVFSMFVVGGIIIYKQRIKKKAKKNFLFFEF